MSSNSIIQDPVARADLIRAVCASLDALEAQRAELNEKMSVLKADKIKGQLGMKIADFSVARRLARFEKDRLDPAMKAMRECFDALDIGQQLNWLDAIGTTGDAADVNANGGIKPGNDDPFAEVPATLDSGKVVSFAGHGDAKPPVDDEDEWHGAASDTAGTDYNAGAEAFAIGVPREDCPHGRGGRRRMWLHGWDKASSDSILDLMTGGSGNDSHPRA